MCRSCLIESEQQFLRPSDVLIKNGARGDQPLKWTPQGVRKLKEADASSRWWISGMLCNLISQTAPQKANDSITCWKTHQDFLSQCSCASVMHKTRAGNTLLSDRIRESHLNEGIGRVRYGSDCGLKRWKKACGLRGDCYVRICITTWLSRT